MNTYYITLTDAITGDMIGIVEQGENKIAALAAVTETFNIDEDNTIVTIIEE